MKNFILIITLIVFFSGINNSCQQDSASETINDKEITQNQLNDSDLFKLITKHKWHFHNVTYKYFNKGSDVKVYNDILQDKNHIQYYHFLENGEYIYIDSLCLIKSKENECIYLNRTRIHGKWALVKPAYMKLYNSVGQSYNRKSSLSNVWLYEIKNHDLQLDDKMYLIESIDNEKFIFTSQHSFQENEHEKMYLISDKDTVKYYSSTYETLSDLSRRRKHKN